MRSHRLFLFSSFCFLFGCSSSENTVPTAETGTEQESTVYYHRVCGCKTETLAQAGVDAASPPDIVVIGTVTGREDSSGVTLDSLEDGWIRETKRKQYIYTTAVDDWIIGKRANEYFQARAVSSEEHEYRKPNLLEITEEGDSIYSIEARVSARPGMDLSANTLIPEGAQCFFHFSDSTMTNLEYIATYTTRGLDNYLREEGLWKAQRISD